jgi:hypothetical protein
MAEYNRHFIWYTDAISALVRAATPLRETIEDAIKRQDDELVGFLTPIYKPMKTKIRSLVREARREHEWNPSELGDEDAAKLIHFM